MKALAREQITAEVLGEALRQLRASRGLTQRVVAKRSQLLTSQISAFERGRHMPSLKNLFNFLMGCCGSVDLVALQRSIERACALGNAVEGSEEQPNLTERLLDLTERLNAHLNGRVQYISAKADQ